MKQVKYLLKNIGILTISQFGTKIISFLLVPLYTSVLSTDEYGIFDFVLTSVQLLLPLLTLNIAEATLRFSLDSENDKRSVYYISIKYLAIASALIVALSAINHITGVLRLLDEYRLYFVFMFITIALGDITSYYARGTDHIKEVGISGVLSTTSMVVLNLIFLIPLKMGLTGYFLSHIISYIIQIIYLSITCNTPSPFKYHNDKNLQVKMLTYSKPMIANAIAWWVNNASDRYIVTWICGISAMGIYSVGYKIPTILHVFQSVFNQAWSLSATKEYNGEKNNIFFSKLYIYYNIGMTLVCAILIAISKLLAYFLYAKDFYKAWQYVPFLLISIVFGSLSGYVGGIFTAVKDSKIIAKSTIIGALTNIVLNIILVYVWGPIGAAIATAICYVIVWIVRMIHVKRYIELNVSIIRDIIGYVFLVFQSAILFLISNYIVLYLLEFFCVAALVCIHHRSIYEMSKNIRKVVQK